ncbi:helix-turn-helix transcriptional regulator [Phenylobacterium sp.]|jgi:transcriptional regulator with XRE-family HTH domain|uniref:helix-turn-helix domain-containing protein n=1 Tax=Phenylobacterium sp. TaxID=1871053 RepID=UPI002E374A9C|nr:helix-turn-helix transcriptional regulator [Phenylobacterium sp.]HEX3366072.1 helix-turn-helix transcriptional regulator [Phenylobacterium sp.]
MFNIVFSDEYGVLPPMLARLRQSAGLSQRDMAKAITRSQGHIHRMETGQRPIELVEFCRMARSAGVDPVQALEAVLREWASVGCHYRSSLPSPVYEAPRVEADGEAPPRLQAFQFGEASSGAT